MTFRHRMPELPMQRCRKEGEVELRAGECCRRDSLHRKECRAFPSSTLGINQRFVVYPIPGALVILSSLRRYSHTLS